MLFHSRGASGTTYSMPFKLIAVHGCTFVNANAALNPCLLTDAHMTYFLNMEVSLEWQAVYGTCEERACKCLAKKEPEMPKNMCLDS